MRLDHHERLGLWAWDPRPKLYFLCPTAAGFHGIEPDAAACGMSQAQFDLLVHSDDTTRLRRAFEASYANTTKLLITYKTSTNEAVEAIGNYRGPVKPSSMFFGAMVRRRIPDENALSYHVRSAYELAERNGFYLVSYLLRCCGVALADAREPKKKLH